MFETEQLIRSMFPLIGSGNFKIADEKLYYFFSQYKESKVIKNKINLELQLKQNKVMNSFISVLLDEIYEQMFEFININLFKIFDLNKYRYEIEQYLVYLENTLQYCEGFMSMETPLCCRLVDKREEHRINDAHGIKKIEKFLIHYLNKKQINFFFKDKINCLVVIGNNIFWGMQIKDGIYVKDYKLFSFDKKIKFSISFMPKNEKYLKRIEHQLEILTRLGKFNNFLDIKANTSTNEFYALCSEYNQVNRLSDFLLDSALTFRGKLNIIEELLNMLEDYHKKGIVNGNISAKNILIYSDSKGIDFGILDVNKKITIQEIKDIFLKSPSLSKILIREKVRNKFNCVLAIRDKFYGNITKKIKKANHKYSATLLSHKFLDKQEAMEALGEILNYSFSKYKVLIENHNHAARFDVPSVISYPRNIRNLDKQNLQKMFQSVRSLRPEIIKNIRDKGQIFKEVRYLFLEYLFLKKKQKKDMRKQKIYQRKEFVRQSERDIKRILWNRMRNYTVDYPDRIYTSIEADNYAMLCVIKDVFFNVNLNLPASFHLENIFEIREKELQAKEDDCSEEDEVGYEYLGVAKKLKRWLPKEDGSVLSDKLEVMIEDYKSKGMLTLFQNLKNENTPSKFQRVKECVFDLRKAVL